MCLSDCLIDGKCEKKVFGFVRPDRSLLYWKNRDSLDQGKRGTVAYPGDAGWEIDRTNDEAVVVPWTDPDGDMLLQHYTLTEFHRIELEILGFLIENGGKICDYSFAQIATEVRSRVRNNKLYYGLIYNRWQSLYKHKLINAPGWEHYHDRIHRFFDEIEITEKGTAALAKYFYKNRSAVSQFY